ncbi:hypothetical protein ACFZDJ_54030 [Streptomyces sp. NPDC007896]|uniref:hypothetical protein n=1 Tax=unclassified Streptomyces TaxID=2593676 RepID=UPI0036E46750
MALVRCGFSGASGPDTGSVFGVKESLAYRFDRHEAGTPAPDGRQPQGTWTSTTSDIVLRKE